MAVALVSGIWCLLIVPKLIVVFRGTLTGDNRSFGGTFHALISTLAEVALSSFVAPLMLWFQSRAVVQVVLGADGGWSAANRGGGRMLVGDAWQSSKWIVASGVLALVVAQGIAPSMVLWLIPIAGPMVIAPVLIWATSLSAERGLSRYLFLAPSELHPAPVMTSRDQILDRWEKLGDPLEGPPGRAGAHLGLGYSSGPA